MRMFEFSWDFPHPDRPNIRVRLVVEMPAFSVAHLPKGTVVERHLRWRSENRA